MAVLLSLEDREGLRCVDIIRRDDGTFTFKEFRKDVEDPVRWYLVNDFSIASFNTREEAVASATAAVPWLKK
jgi:hypothetical protein